MKILCLYLRTGGGHLAPARAIASHIEENRLADAKLVDGLEGANRFVRYIIEDGYRILQSQAKWYYEFLYALNTIPFVARLNLWLISLFITPILVRCFRRESPGKVVIFHFLLIKPTFDALAACGLDIPVITLVTDPYTAHPMWFLRPNQNFIVFSDRLKQQCISLGIPESNIARFPFVLSGRFSHPLPPEAIVQTKQRLGFPTDRRIILILGGGDGIPRGEKILQHLLAGCRDVEIAMVCGKDKSLYQRAVELSKETGSSLKVFGYIDFVFDLVSIADLVITKCGASTFMEILLLGKIPIVTDYIWGQEKGNVEFLQQTKTGYYEPQLKSLPGLVHTLLTNKALYEDMTRNIISARLVNGTVEVARFIVGESSGQVVPAKSN